LERTITVVSLLAQGNSTKCTISTATGYYTIEAFDNYFADTLQLGLPLLIQSTSDLRAVISFLTTTKQCAGITTTLSVLRKNKYQARNNGVRDFAASQVLPAWFHDGNAPNDEEQR
jgi:hypothetical protein